MDREGFFVSNKCFFLPGHFELLAHLNSRVAWFWVFGEASPLRGGKWRLELREQYVAQLPIPKLSKAARDRLAGLGESLTRLAKGRFEIQSTVRHRILTDLGGPSRRAALSRKLGDWWTLDIGAFRAEVKRAFLADIPVRERADWEAYLGMHGIEVRTLDTEIEKAEREIDAIVYRLFDLTSEEVALLESSLAGQY
jgi:hypothetical protein